MASSITKEQIELFKWLISKYEPYSFDVLDKVGYDKDNYDDDRLFATYAKKILIENGIEI